MSAPAGVLKTPAGATWAIRYQSKTGAGGVVICPASRVAEEVKRLTGEGCRVLAKSVKS